MLTAKQFSEQTGVSYPLIIRWAKAGELKGAIYDPSVRAWRIPEKLVAFYKKPENKPKRGWKPGRKRGPASE